MLLQSAAMVAKKLSPGCFAFLKNVCYQYLNFCASRNLLLFDQLLIGSQPTVVVEKL